MREVEGSDDPALGALHRVLIEEEFADTDIEGRRLEVDLAGVEEKIGREDRLVEGHRVRLTCRPVVRRFELQPGLVPPAPFAGDSRCYPYPVGHRFADEVDTCDGVHVIARRPRIAADVEVDVERLRPEFVVNDGRDAGSPHRSDDTGRPRQGFVVFPDGEAAPEDRD